MTEKNREVAVYHHRMAESGALSEAEAREGARRIMLNQSIGRTAYAFLLDARGNTVLHPFLSGYHCDAAD